MSELTERRWSVISERGCEVMSVPYEDAARLVRQLTGEDVRGLCVISDEAARRLVATQQLARGPRGAKPSR